HLLRILVGASRRALRLGGSRQLVSSYLSAERQVGRCDDDGNVRIGLDIALVAESTQGKNSHKGHNGEGNADPEHQTIRALQNCFSRQGRVTGVNDSRHGLEWSRSYEWARTVLIWAICRGSRIGALRRGRRATKKGVPRGPEEVGPWSTPFDGIS